PAHPAPGRPGPRVGVAAEAGTVEPGELFDTPRPPDVLLHGGRAVQRDADTILRPPALAGDAVVRVRDVGRQRQAMEEIRCSGGLVRRRCEAEVPGEGTAFYGARSP